MPTAFTRAVYANRDKSLAVNEKGRIQSTAVGQQCRISGRIFIASGFITAASAIVINIVFPPFGGMFKSLAVYIFSVAQIVTLTIAVRAILRRDIARHRVWMIRAFAIGLAISTMRIFFIPAYLLYGVPSDFTVGLGMWIGFVVNICVAELILWRERVKGVATKATRNVLSI